MRLDHLLSKEKRNADGFRWKVGAALLSVCRGRQRPGRMPGAGEVPVAMRLREIPVPIPNTMVKTQAADGTTPGTAWESRWPPGHEKNRKGMAVP